MFTSRAEYRILLRQDDADARLTEMSYKLGLAKKDRYDRWMEKKREIERIIAFCDNTPVHPKDINSALEAMGTTPLHFGCKISDLIARPQISMEKLAEVIPELKEAISTNAWTYNGITASNNGITAEQNGITEKGNGNHPLQEEIIEAAEVRIKYKGYIEREKIVADKMHRLENIRIKGHFKYSEIKEISTEGRQKLERIDPDTLAEASRIPGVSPSDINVLLVLLGR